MITYPTNKLQKVLLAGKCQQGVLPDGYTQVEYINTNGGYIYLNYIFTTDNQKKVIKFKNITAVTGSSAPYAIFGTQVNSNRTPYLALKSNGKIGLGVGSQGAGNSPTEINNPSTPVTVVIETKSGNTLIFMGGSTDYNTTWSGTIQTGENETLGRLNITTSSGLYSGSADFYRYSLYADNIMVRDLIPARRNSDSVLGMYDTVTGSFLTNQGEGTFTAGADVVPTPDNPIDIVCNNGVVKVSKNLFDKANATTLNLRVMVSNSVLVSNSQRYGFAIPVKGSTTYTISRTDNKYLNICLCSQYPVEELTVLYIAAGDALQYTVTTEANTTYLYLYTGSQNVVDNLQIELGSTATTYMPYGQIYTDGTVEQVTDSLGNTASAERLLAVGDYKDTQSVLDGKVTRNIGIKVLDGSEDWVLSNSSYQGINRNLFYTLISNALGDTMSICSIASSTIVLTRSPAPVCRLTVAKNFNVVPFSDTTTIPTVEAWKSYLADQYAAGTPVIVVYPIAEPATEQVTPQPLTGSTATVTAGSIDNLPIESSTIAELKKRYIGDKEVKRVYIGDNLVWENN